MEVVHFALNGLRISRSCCRGGTPRLGSAVGTSKGSRRRPGGRDQGLRPENRRGHGSSHPERL